MYIYIFIMYIYMYIYINMYVYIYMYVFVYASIHVLHTHDWATSEHVPKLREWDTSWNCLSFRHLRTFLIPTATVAYYSRFSLWKLATIINHLTAIIEIQNSGQAIAIHLPRMVCKVYGPGVWHSHFLRV